MSRYYFFFYDIYCYLTCFLSPIWFDSSFSTGPISSSVSLTNLSACTYNVYLIKPQELMMLAIFSMLLFTILQPVWRIKRSTCLSTHSKLSEFWQKDVRAGKENAIWLCSLFRSFYERLSQAGYVLYLRVQFSKVGFSLLYLFWDLQLSSPLSFQTLGSLLPLLLPAARTSRSSLVISLLPAYTPLDAHPQLNLFGITLICVCHSVSYILKDITKR